MIKQRVPKRIKTPNVNIQNKGLNRNSIDKFYTKESVAKLCVDEVKRFIMIDENDIVIEPSAGDGAFIEGIKELSNNYMFYDIEPEHEEIIRQDFLNLNINNLKQENIHIVGNPPFGRQSTSAIQFIKKCCEFASSISFILPKSFKKDSMQKYFPLNYHLIFEMDLQSDSFLVNNEETDVPCVFQIWIRRNEMRNKIIKLTPIDFEFVKQSETSSHPDISFRRVGVYAGKISPFNDKDTKSIQSHYFIKFTNGLSLDENLNRLKYINFEYDNTVGPKSISKQELIKEFNRVLAH